MSTNHYTQTTIFGNFQALGFGDRIWPDVEIENWQKVENRLLAMNIENFLISRGVYSVTTLNASTKLVNLAQSGLQVAFEGAINGSYFNIEDTISWSVSTLTLEKTYYLYIREVTGQVDPTSIDSIDTDVFDYELTSSSDKKNRLLMAIVYVNSSGEVSVTDENPQGQLQANNFLNHITDSQNPHGSVLTQASLVAGAITLGGQPLYTEHIYDETFTCGTDKTINMRTVLSLDPGTDLEVKFVQVCITSFGESVTPSDNYFLWIVYDANADTAQFTIKTTGNTAYAMSAKVLVKYIVNE